MVALRLFLELRSARGIALVVGRRSGDPFSFVLVRKISGPEGGVVLDQGGVLHAVVVAHFVVVGAIYSIGDVISQLFGGLGVHLAAELVEPDLPGQFPELAELDLVGPHGAEVDVLAGRVRGVLVLLAQQVLLELVYLLAGVLLPLLLL